MIRDQKVLLSHDLAGLYGVSVKVLDQAVKRNLERFPSDFMFQLTLSETRNLRSQILTIDKGGHFRYRPYAFTEQGVAMLSAVLRSGTAVAVVCRSCGRLFACGYCWLQMKRFGGSWRRWSENLKPR